MSGQFSGGSRRHCVDSLKGRMLLRPGVWDRSFSGDGQATMDFGGGVSVSAHDVAVQSDGKTVVVGSSSTHDFAIARFNLDGTPDLTFGSNHNGHVLTHVGKSQSAARAVAIQNDGKI